MKIVIGDFLRQTFIKNNWTHFEPLGEHIKNTTQEEVEKELILRVKTGMAAGQSHKGYRDGVVLVKINPQGFKARVRELKAGDYLFGQFKPRVEGEIPRKKVGVLEPNGAPEAKFVDAVLYHRDVLNETEDMHRAYDYEIVAFLTKNEDIDEPMETEVLMHNHFGSDGGSDTKMSNDEFVEALRKSHSYWKNKAQVH